MFLWPDGLSPSVQKKAEAVTAEFSLGPLRVWPLDSRAIFRIYIVLCSYVSNSVKTFYPRLLTQSLHRWSKRLAIGCMNLPSLQRLLGRRVTQPPTYPSQPYISHRFCDFASLGAGMSPRNLWFIVLTTSA